jgi:hypothetical protein
VYPQGHQGNKSGTRGVSLEKIRHESCLICSPFNGTNQ